MSSAYSITRSVNTPRAVYLDFPLGHTAGRAGDKALQRKVMIDTLSALDTIQVPGTIRTLPYRWADTDEWKDKVMRPNSEKGQHADDRVERSPDPQYQLEDDRQAAELNLAKNGCSDCIWLAEQDMAR
ncbi:MAG: hypothetical protein O7E57_11040 [Gammaproteobacteria bacterium]|nr:hypothetical protein [Gammaproteobacteria bacterium]